MLLSLFPTWCSPAPKRRAGLADRPAAMSCLVARVVATGVASAAPFCLTDLFHIAPEVRARTTHTTAYGQTHKLGFPEVGRGCRSESAGSRAAGYSPVLYLGEGSVSRANGTGSTASATHLAYEDSSLTDDWWSATKLGFQMDVEQEPAVQSAEMTGPLRWRTDRTGSDSP
ncbi:hypothetical protein CMUS01_14255 [Colletotrichum musicola]|uniref:Uncharacterized protein n=1 Tax=Colletotrichum musicola TaxID=2175873 RepID=A0A8H6J5H3_9PEZI|nr:hypothetical protein CMUS01_14255 [Colletotrichum musicola]